MSIFTEYIMTNWKKAKQNKKRIIVHNILHRKRQIEENEPTTHRVHSSAPEGTKTSILLVILDIKSRERIT